jgi:GntR family transcriptional regulator
MPSQTSPIPLYHQVYTVLRQRVADGTYPPGTRLAPEDELAAEFDVSRATIRQAVGELVKTAVVSRRQGRGTFVLDTAHESLGQAFRGNLGNLIGEVRRTRIRDVEIEHDATIPVRIAEQLGLEQPRGTIVRRTRLMDGDAFAYTVNYLPAELGRKLTKRELSPSGLTQLLANKGIAIHSARQTIRAQLADVTVSHSLDVTLGTAVLFVERLLTGKDDAPVEFVQSWYRGDLYAYTVTFERANGDFDRQLA